MSSAASPNVQIILNGTQVAGSNFLSYTVDRDMHQPDMASIVLSNQGDEYTTKTKVGDSVEVKVGDSSTSIYKGEVVGIEPTYKGGEKTRVLIRAMNKFHRLLRKRKSMTYTDMTDQAILQQVVGDAGLSLQWKHDTSITYKHVYQHNQTDMEFVRTRAARMGCHVWCIDTTLYVQQPDLQSGPIATLDVDQSQATGALRSFTPRLSSHATVKKVTVKGWNPETKQLITGQASIQDSPLGGQNSATGAGDLASDETFTVDHPIWSTEEANAIAAAKLQEYALSYVTGEAEVTGDPTFDLGKVVQINANADPNADPSADPFNGKYYIMGITHRHIASKSKDSGFVTILRLARDAQMKA
jgi:phage protein D